MKLLNDQCDFILLKRMSQLKVLVQSWPGHGGLLTWLSGCGMAPGLMLHQGVV